MSVCLLPVPVSTLSCTPFHRSPTINSQRFALFDSTFSVRFKLISHSLSAPFPLPLRSARPKTCPLVSCASASASAAGRGCRQPTPARHEPRGSWVHFVRTGTEGPSCTKVVAIAPGRWRRRGTRVAKRSAGREDGEVTEPPRGVGPETGDNARVQRGGTAGRRGRRDARTRSAAEARADDERLLARVTEGKRRARVHCALRARQRPPRQAAHAHRRHTVAPCSSSSRSWRCSTTPCCGAR